MIKLIAELQDKKIINIIYNKYFILRHRLKISSECLHQSDNNNGLSIRKTRNMSIQVVVI